MVSAEYKFKNKKITNHYKKCTTGMEARKAFKQLREKYRREVEKTKIRRQNGTKGKEWIFLSSLRFLDMSYKKRK